MTASTRQEIRHRDRCGSKAPATRFRGNFPPMPDSAFQSLAQLIEAATFLHGERQTLQAVCAALEAVGIEDAAGQLAELAEGDSE